MDASASLIARKRIRFVIGFAGAAVVMVGGCNSGTQKHAESSPVSASPVTTAAPIQTPVPADVAAGVRERVIGMWPDINHEARGGGPQNREREANIRLAPSTGSIATADEMRTLRKEYGDMRPSPDPQHEPASDISLVSQSPPIDFSTTQPPSISVPVCYSFEIAPIGNGAELPPTGSVFATALLGLRNPRTDPKDLANPSMWGMFSVTNIAIANGCGTD